MESIRHNLHYSDEELNAVLETSSFFIYRNNKLVRTSQKTLDLINNPSKATPLIRRGLEKLQRDAARFEGNFPKDYYASFSKDMIRQSLRLESDPDKGIDKAGEAYGSEVEDFPEALPVYHVYESIVGGYDKVQHFTRSAVMQYNWSDTITDLAQYGKEILFDEIPSWFGTDIGFDPNDMYANNLGQTYGEKIYMEYHPVRDMVLNPSVAVDKLETYLGKKFDEGWGIFY